MMWSHRKSGTTLFAESNDKFNNWPKHYKSKYNKSYLAGYKKWNNIFLPNWSREDKREEKLALMQELGLARAFRHFERMKGGS
jgi:hypothetical protein